MTYSAILVALRAQRKVEEEAEAEKIRVEYGPSFHLYFSYKKGQETIVLSNPTDIINRYRALKGAT